MNEVGKAEQRLGSEISQHSIERRIAALMSFGDQNQVNGALNSDRLWDAVCAVVSPFKDTGSVLHCRPKHPSATYAEYHTEHL